MLYQKLFWTIVLYKSKVDLWYDNNFLTSLFSIATSVCKFD